MKSSVAVVLAVLCLTGSVYSQTISTNTFFTNLNNFISNNPALALSFVAPFLAANSLGPNPSGVIIPPPPPFIPMVPPMAMMPPIIVRKHHY